MCSSRQLILGVFFLLTMPCVSFGGHEPKNRISPHDSVQLGSFLLTLLPKPYLEMDPGDKFTNKLTVEGTIIPDEGDSDRFEIAFALVISASGDVTLYGTIPRKTPLRDQLQENMKRGTAEDLSGLDIKRVSITNTPELIKLAHRIMGMSLSVKAPEDFWLHAPRYSIKFMSMDYTIQLEYWGYRNVRNKEIRRLLSLLSDLRKMLRSAGSEKDES